MMFFVTFSELITKSFFALNVKLNFASRTLTVSSLLTHKECIIKIYSLNGIFVSILGTYSFHFWEEEFQIPKL